VGVLAAVAAAWIYLSHPQSHTRAALAIVPVPGAYAGGAAVGF
jgi:hypothetical protein